MMLITIIFILLFAIAISRGIRNGASEKDYIQALIEKKPRIEYVIPVKRKTHLDGQILDYMEYLKEKRQDERIKFLMDQLGSED